MDTNEQVALVVGSTVACAVIHYIFTPICKKMEGKEVEGAPCELAQTVVSVPTCLVISSLYAWVFFTSAGDLEARNFSKSLALDVAMCVNLGLTAYEVAIYIWDQVR